MRWRTLLLMGAVLYAVGLGLGFVAWELLAPDEPLVAGAVIISLLAGPVFLAVLGLLAGWFGREGDNVTLVAIGFGIGASLLLNAAAIAVGRWHPAVLVFGVAAAVIGATAGRFTWWIGNAVCEIRGLASAPELVGPAFPDEVSAEAMWTTRAASTLRTSLEVLAETIAPGAPVDAGAIGVLVGFPRDRAIAVALAAERLGIQPVDLEGAPIGSPTVIEPADLAEVSIRSEAVDGTSRDHVNAFDDLIEIRTRDGGRLRIRLPYGARGTGTRRDGVAPIRTWLRTSAASYR